MFGRWRPKRKADGLAKYLYLTDKQLVYRLINGVGSAPIESRLDAFYKQLEILRSERNSAALMYTVMFVGCLLSKFDLLTNVSAAGISVLPIALKHVLLAGYSVSQLRLSAISSKFTYISGVFDYKFYLSSASTRANMLARYPLALDIMKYYPGQIGTLPHTASMRTPKRMIAMLVLLGFGLLTYAAFAVWLYVSLAHDVWVSTTPLPTLWSRAVVVVSLSIALASCILPADLLFKRSYMHIGLIKMMNKAHDKDKSRWLLYYEWIKNIREKPGT